MCCSWRGAGPALLTAAGGEGGQGGHHPCTYTTSMVMIGGASSCSLTLMLAHLCSLHQAQLCYAVQTRCRALSSFLLCFSIPKGTSSSEMVWGYTAGAVPFSPQDSFFTVVAMVPVFQAM